VVLVGRLGERGWGIRRACESVPWFNQQFIWKIGNEGHESTRKVRQPRSLPEPSLGSPLMGA